MSSDTAKEGLSIVKKISPLAGDQRITVSRYGFKKEYPDYTGAAKALGCGHEELFNKLQSNRDAVVFVIHRKGRFSYI